MKVAIMSNVHPVKSVNGICINSISNLLMGGIDILRSTVLKSAASTLKTLERARPRNTRLQRASNTTEGPKREVSSKFQGWTWEELEVGRLAVLRLGGDQGQLDIFSVYFDCHSTGDRQFA